MQALNNNVKRKKARFLVPLALSIVMLLLAAIIAMTQESSVDFSDIDIMYGEAREVEMYEEEDEEEEPVWMAPGPPRWFRSNAAGMLLDEIPSRLAALRNQFALVVDYISPDELDPLLLPYLNDGYVIQIRVLHRDGEETRRQWLFIDNAETVRLNAVFRYIETEHVPDDDEMIIDEMIIDEMIIVEVEKSQIAVGFIELFDENSIIFEDHVFLESALVLRTQYFYNESLLIASETAQMEQGGHSEFILLYTDNYRYNRSFSLRNVERVFHEAAALDPIRHIFPYRVLEAAANAQFFSDILPPSSDFFGESVIEEGSRIVYDTDARGRVLRQTLLDSEEEIVWEIINTWLDDRIIAISRIEGNNEMRTEYEYNSAGDRITQRDINNGVVERLVRIDGSRETEELFMDGILVLRAYWDDGIKISEERVRR